MSLILEALRKSEAERRRGEMPDLRAELPPPVAPRRASLRMLPWLAALAAIAIVAALLALHPWSRGTTAITNAPAEPTPEPKPIPAESVRLQPRPPATVAAASTPRTVEPTARPAADQPVQAIDATPPPAPSSPEPAPTAPRVAETVPPPSPTTPGNEETPVNALPADLRKALPPLQLTMHMWDPDPAKRFVILDGERHVEGDSVGPMRILRIDAAGVLFDWQGRAVRLPLR